MIRIYLPSQLVNFIGIWLGLGVVIATIYWPWLPFALAGAWMCGRQAFARREPEPRDALQDHLSGGGRCS